MSLNLILRARTWAHKSAAVVLTGAVLALTMPTLALAQAASEPATTAAPATTPAATPGAAPAGPSVTQEAVHNPYGLKAMWEEGDYVARSTLILLIIAVIGGISYFEGAWAGALVYVLLQTYTTSIPLIDRIGLTPDRFNTIIGLCVLLIMVLSPEGLVGIIERLRRGRGFAKPTEHSIEPATSSEAVHSASGREA